MKRKFNIGDTIAYETIKTHTLDIEKYVVIRFKCDIKCFVIDLFINKNEPINIYCIIGEKNKIKGSRFGNALYYPKQDGLKISRMVLTEKTNPIFKSINIFYENYDESNSDIE